MNLSIDPSPLAPARKFMFDRSFDDELDRAALEGEKVEATYTESQVEAIRNAAFESGFTEGQKKFEDSLRQQLNTILADVAKKLESLADLADPFWKKQMDSAKNIALATVRKILPVYVERNGVEEIQAVVISVLKDTMQEPRLVVRVSEAQFDAVNERVKILAERQAYAGKMIVLGEPAMGPADCRVEWADGGVERDAGALEQEISRIVGNACVRAVSITSGEKP